MTAEPEPLTRLHNVSFGIDQKTLVHNISLDIYPYEVVSLIGPNGAGKSTLVKLILGLISPSEGYIYRQKNLLLGYVPQKFNPPAILPLKVSNLLAQANKHRLSHDEQQAVLTSLDINTLLSSQVTTLSGGELQRVLLAKALLDKPDLLVLDEPMQGLDPDAQIRLYELIDGLPDFLRCAMLVVSHDLHWVMKGTKRVVCLNKHICCQGTPSDIAYDEHFVALFGNTHQHRHEAPYIHHHSHCHHPL